MTTRREKVVLSYEDLFTGRMAHMKRANVVFSRLMDQNSHPLDRVEPGSVGPQLWPGDDS